MVYQPLLASKKSTVDRSMRSTIFENSGEGVFQQPAKPGGAESVPAGVWDFLTLRGELPNEMFNKFRLTRVIHMV